MAITASTVPVILWFGEDACCDPAQVGGKAAHLSRLATDYRVPPGFCLAAAAFDPTHPPDAPLPEALIGALAAAYRALCRCCGVADVPGTGRSSALDEDGDLASFAGQHETELNLTGIDSILGAVARCWASARNERALAYRRKQQGLEIEGVKLAVLVQQLVVADVSAVVFSANPAAGERSGVVATTSWGLGESLGLWEAACCF
jgi:pyruvate,water dikinase